ncbi:MAG: hypothetical protein ACFB20_06210 [Opitutales bacterium]
MRTFSQNPRAFLRLVLLLVVPGILCLTGCNTVDPATYSTVKLPPAMTYPAHPSQIDYPLGEHIHLRAPTTPTTPAPAAPNRDLPLPPAYVSEKPGQTLGRDQILAELRAEGVRTRFNVTDNRYIVPSHDWVKREYQPFFDWYLRYLDTDYHAEGMDCDNYSNFYKQNLVLANLRSGGSRHGDVPCAVMIVNQRDKGIIHALNLIRTDRGWYAVEPQEGHVWSLSSYKYLRDIQYIDM